MQGEQNELTLKDVERLRLACDCGARLFAVGWGQVAGDSDITIELECDHGHRWKVSVAMAEAQCYLFCWKAVSGPGSTE